MSFALRAAMLTSDPAFVPPHCPNPRCKHHRGPHGTWNVRRKGTYQRQAHPQVIRRFKCLDCGRGFSTQTFDTTYYLKKPHLQASLHAALVACACFRQLGRMFRVAHSTMQRQASRLGRHALLFDLKNRPKAPPTEELVLDGLLSFEYSQFWPFETNVLVGGDSHFVYGVTDSELRRSGSMTPAQKLKRAALEKEHGKPDPKATQHAVEALIRHVAPKPVPLTIRMDMHQAYPRAIRCLPHAVTVKTVSSRRCRTARNPLFAVDLLDLLFRHGGSNHKRETIAFSKRRQGAIERSLVTICWRNYEKRISENDRQSLTPAQALGLMERALTVADVLNRRLFPTHFELRGHLHRYYYRDTETRQIPDGTRHDLKRAA